MPVDFSHSRDADRNRRLFVWFRVLFAVATLVVARGSREPDRNAEEPPA